MAKQLEFWVGIALIVGALNIGLGLFGFGMIEKLPATFALIVNSLIGLSGAYKLFEYSK